MSSSTTGADERDDDEVRDERRGAARVPAVGHEPLLLARLEEEVEEDADDPDRDERGEEPAGRAAPGAPARRRPSVAGAIPRASARTITRMIPYWTSPPTAVDQR